MYKRKLAAASLLYLLHQSRKPCEEPCDCCTDASSEESEDCDTTEADEAHGSQPNGIVQKQQSSVRPTAGSPKQLQTEDKYDVFGKYIASKLRQLQDQQRIFVERIIHEAILEGQMANLNINSQLIVNTDTTVYDEPHDGETMGLQVPEMAVEKEGGPEIKNGIDVLWQCEDEKKDVSHNLGDVDRDMVSDPCSQAKIRRLDEKDVTSDLCLGDVPDIKVEIITDDHENLLEYFETEYDTNTQISPTNVGKSNSSANARLNEPQVAVSCAEVQISDIKEEVDIEENWYPQDDEERTDY